MLAYISFRGKEKFYYEIKFNNGKIMDMGIKKTSSDKYLYLVKFDQQYIDRFQRILGNK